MVKLLPTKHVKAMVKAMETAAVFTLEKDWQSGVVRALHGKKEVYAAIQKGSGGHWIVRHHDQLFA
jgi:hypothetical protein